MLFRSAPWGERQARPRTREAYGAWLVQLLAAATDPAPGPGVPFDERVLVGLRRREGVALQALAEAAGLGAEALGALQLAWQPYRQAGLLLQEGPRWRLSDPEGLALSNAVLRALMGWWEQWGPATAAAAPPPSP